MKNQIILTAESVLIDKQARVWLEKQNTKIETLNKRTKSLVIDIKELKKEIRELKKALGK